MSNREIPIGIYGGTLALVEAGLGSLLHAWKVPLTGTMLSLNQSYFLSYIVRTYQNTPGVASASYRISNITALLKSLSPAGKKLTPMLAIACQGGLFSLGTTFFGANPLGVVAGSCLLAVWGIFQPIALTALVYGLAFSGPQVERMVGYYSKLLSDVSGITSQGLLWGVAVVFTIKIVCAAGLALHAWYGKSDGLERWQEWLASRWHRPLIKPKNVTNGSAWSLALRDSTKPLFLVPVLMTGLFYGFAEHELAPVLWAMLRPFAIGYLVFLIIRMVNWERVIRATRTKNPAFADAIEFLNSEKEGKL